jgi:hypothetical protein
MIDRKSHRHRRHHIVLILIYRFTSFAFTATARASTTGPASTSLQSPRLGFVQQLVHQSQSRSPNRLGDRPALRWALRANAATAASVNHTVGLPRRTSAASYSGQFVTRYLAVGILWRRLSLNLYGMGS